MNTKLHEEEEIVERSVINLNLIFSLTIFLYLIIVIAKSNSILSGVIFFSFIALIIGSYWLHLGTKHNEDEGMVVYIIRKYFLNPIKSDNGSNMVLFYGGLGCVLLFLSPISSWFVYDMNYQYYFSYSYPDTGYYSEENNGFTYSFYFDGITVSINEEREEVTASDWYDTYSYWLNSYHYPVYETNDYSHYKGFEDVQDLTKTLKYLVWSSVILWTCAFLVYSYKIKRFLETKEIRDKIKSLSGRIGEINLKLGSKNETDNAILPTSAITAKLDESKIRPYVVAASSKTLLSGLIILTFISIFSALMAILMFETSFISMTHGEYALVSINEDSPFTGSSDEIRVNGEDGPSDEYGWTFEWGRGYGIYFIHMGLLSYLGLVYNSIILMKLDKKDDGDIGKLFDNLFVKE